MSVDRTSVPSNNEMQLTSGGLLAVASRPPSLSRRLQLISVFYGLCRAGVE
jgi:hypothetical protein